MQQLPGPTSTGLVSALRLTRTTAWMTMAIPAGASPRKMASAGSLSPRPTYTADRPSRLFPGYT